MLGREILQKLQNTLTERERIEKQRERERKRGEGEKKNIWGGKLGEKENG